MSEIKIEIGQFWESKSDVLKVEILKAYTTRDGESRFAVMLKWDYGVTQVGSRTEEAIRGQFKLITNADGTPYQEPKQYRDINVWEAMRLLGEAREPILVQVRDSGEWYNKRLVGAIGNADFQFKDTNGHEWKQCRIEVKS